MAVLVGSFSDAERQYSGEEHMLWIQCNTGKPVKKDKVVLLRSIEAHLGDRRYSSYFFLTSALEGGERQASTYTK
jgi:hypothetical protein